MSPYETLLDVLYVKRETLEDDKIQKHMFLLDKIFYMDNLQLIQNTDTNKQIQQLKKMAELLAVDVTGETTSQTLVARPHDDMVPDFYLPTVYSSLRNIYI
jgi:hypothetical protein